MSDTEPGFRLELPSDFDEYEWEIETKGYFPADATIRGRKIVFFFYDPVRLSQTVEERLRNYGFFDEPNLVVVPQVNRKTMLEVISRISLQNYSSSQD